MVKKLNIPFIKSRGWECGQACMAMMIKYYYSDFGPDFDKLNKIIKHKDGMYTFPPQLAILLDYYGIKSQVFSSDNVNRFDEDPNQFKRWFGKDYEHEMQFIGRESFDWMVDEMRSKNLFTKKKTKFSELLNEFQKGNLVGFPIDWNTLVGKKGSYEGHFIVISGIQGQNILIHDPDVGPFIEYPILDIKRAWSHPAIAQDYIVAYGKKYLPICPT